MLRRWESETNVVMRFVIGNFPDAQKQKAADAEEQTQGDILRVLVEEHYDNLPYKVMLMLPLTGLHVPSPSSGSTCGSGVAAGVECSASVYALEAQRLSAGHCRV